jgi:uncharacterized protein YaiE (UPF0345 family)
MKGMLKALTAVAMATAFTASTAHAQTPVTFGVGGGVNLPLSNFKDVAKLGFQGTALVQFAPANLPVGFRVDGTYQQNKYDDDFATAFGDGKWQTIYGTANVVYTFKTAETSKIHPYLIAGGGVYNLKDKPDAGTSASSTKFGANAGAGFDMAVGSAKVFLEGRFHNIFVSGNNQSFVPITVGVKFGG